MRRITICVILLSMILLYGCKGETKKLDTRTVTVGENKFTVQLMPASFQEGADDESGKFDYFRIIIESKAKMMDSSHVNYLNFGMESSISKVVDMDTTLPAFMQRVANGKKENYEYIVSFEKTTKDKKFEILINDQVFEMGQISVKF